MLHQIGAGALGPVFRAFEPDRGRLVAVKLFQIDLPPDRVHRLVAELERLIAAGLTHAGIAAPVATGIEGARAYLAYEFVAADSLDTIVRDYGPAPVATALRFAVQLAGALDFAAVVSVTHGALHPRDILISNDDASMTGLGVAGALAVAGAAAPVRRPYTAPERVAGRDWDRRADVFSLAAIVHEMLWGRKPQRIGGQAADDLTELPGCDLDGLRSAFARALAEKPEDRFDTALGFAAALRESVPDGVEKPRSAGAGQVPSVDGRQPPVREPESTAVGSEPVMPLFASASIPEASDREISSPAPETDVHPAREDRAVARTEHTPPVGDLALQSDDRAGSSDAAPPIASAELRAAETARFKDVETQPTVAPEPAIVRPPPTVLSLHDPVTLQPANDGAGASMWPLALALVVGLALGFAGGYGVGSRDRAAIAGQAGPSSRSKVPADAATDVATNQPKGAATSGREFTEAPVGEQPGGAETKAAPAPSAPTAPPQAPRESPKPPASAATVGRLLVRSTPAGARVFVDGRERGRTPATVRDLAHGPHRVRVVQDGYVTDERRIVLTESRPAQAMSFALTRTRPTEPSLRASAASFFGALSVDSRPAGAKVFVDGHQIGTTPVVMPQLAAGAHVVRLEHDGYRSWSSSVRIVSGEQNRVTASLER